MTRKLRVFLCHASEDKPAVRELYYALKSEEWIDPWLDKAKILPGQDWEMVIEKAVDDSDVVIACLSNSSVTKEGFVQREIRYTYDIALEKPEDTIFLIPLRLDNCNVPRKLRTLHWVDYFGVEKENAFSDLLHALQQRYEQKMRLEAEELARRQTEEQARREADALARKVAAEKTAKEKSEREALEKIALKKTAIEADDKAKHDRIKKTAPENPEPIIGVDVEKSNKRALKLDSRLGTLGAVVLIIIAYFGVNIFLNNQPNENVQVTSEVTPTSVSPTRTQVNTRTSIPITHTPTTTPTITPTTAPTATPVLKIGSTKISENDKMILHYVPAGEFTMGSNAGNADEGETHQVFLNAFWIDETEVTNSMYALCVQAGGCDTPNITTFYDDLEYADHPVVYVSWYDAINYCDWANRKLPTEAEWEKAARGTDGRTFPWGGGISEYYANFNQNLEGTTPVRSYEGGKSPYGAYDMAGNVLEWVTSLYRLYPYDANDGREDLSATGSRMLRGGSWFTLDKVVPYKLPPPSAGWGQGISYSVRSTLRYHDAPTLVNFSVGFRCVLETTP